MTCPRLNSAHKMHRPTHRRRTGESVVQIRILRVQTIASAHKLNQVKVPCLLYRRLSAVSSNTFAPIWKKSGRFVTTINVPSQCIVRSLFIHPPSCMNMELEDGLASRKVLPRQVIRPRLNLCRYIAALVASSLFIILKHMS